MAAKRSIPTNLFDSPDFFELSTDTIRLILIGVILDADDEGRGSAHPRLLARKLDKSPEDIEQALTELEAHGILRCYTVEDRCYYLLHHWEKYQVLSRPTPSNYPPPDEGPSLRLSCRENPGISRIPQDSPGDLVPEGEGEKKGRESEQEEKRKEAEGEGDTTPGICPSSALSSADRSLSAAFTCLDETKRIAALLKLSVSDDLGTIVEEFFQTPTISLVGEAIEARAWIDDQRRNSKGQPMTLAFFRRWLKRARGDYGTLEPRSASLVTVSKRSRNGGAPGIPTAEPQQESENPYHTFFLQRLAEVKADYAQNAQEAAV